MEKINLLDVNEEFYIEKLDNGLEIYMLPKKDRSETYVTFTTRFGSVNTEFVPIGTNKMISVHNGIAHFLEHKMFETESGEDPFEFYSKNGASCNANTTFNKTTYLYLGSGHLRENVNYLLDYVQSIYLTDQNIEKEKGIIEQEINMYKDDSFWTLYEGILAACFKENNIKNSIAGSVEDIMAITKDELMDCYNTFYHPSNMFLVATGNFDPDEFVTIVKENQSKKEHPVNKKIKLKEYIEKDEVVKSYQETKLSVMEPKVAFAIKISKKNIKIDDEIKVNKYLNIFANSLFGATSLFVESSRKKGILTDSGIEFLNTPTHYLFCLFLDSSDPKQIVDDIRDTLKNTTITKSDFERRKKVAISNTIASFDNIVEINDIITSNIIMYNNYVSNQTEIIRSLSFDEFNNLINGLDLTNESVYVVNPIAEE